jgi:trehalose 6-phosphate phosphatase
MKQQVPVFARLERYALFLDIDGTLSDIAPSPEVAFVDFATVEVIHRLYDELGGALAVISGRQLSDIDWLIGRSAQNAAGSHGAELRKAGQRLNGSAAPVIDIDAMATLILERFSNAPGLRIERKPFSVALHYRANPALAGAVEDFVDQLVVGYADVTKLKGKMIVEIVPAEVNKGRAVTTFMSYEPFLGRIPIFAGDDATDEHGFEAVNALQGISIKIGHGPTCARYRFNDAAQFRQWLTQLGSVAHSTD